MTSTTYTSFQAIPNGFFLILIGLGGSSLAAMVVWGLATAGLISSLGLLIACFVVLLTSFIGRQIIKGQFDPLESGNIFLFFFTLYVLSLPVLTYLQGDSVSTIASTPAIVEATGLSLLGLAGFLWAYRSNFGSRIAERLPVIDGISTQAFEKAVLIIVFATAVWVAAFIYSVGGLREFLSVGYADIYEIEQGKELLGFSLTVIPTCVLLLYALAVQKRSLWTWLIFTSAFGFVIALLLTGSRRRLLVTTGLALVVYRYYVVKRISWKLLLGAGVFVSVGASLLGVLRAVPPELLFSRQTIEFVSDQSPSQLFYAFLEVGEPATDFETFPFIIEQVSQGTHFKMGSTYLQAPLILIPRALYPTRPDTASQWYTNTFFPEVAANLGGRPLFILGESYLNFGMLGPVAMMIFLAAVFRVAYSYLTQNHFKAEAVLIYATVIGWIPSGIRIDFATTFKVSIVSSLPIVLFVLWYSGRRALKVGVA